MIVKAAQAFKNETAKAQSEYLTAYGNLPHCAILNMAQITNKNDLTLREEKIKVYLLAAEHFQGFLGHWDDLYKEQVRTNVPDEYIQRTLIEGFPSIYGKIQAQAMLIRKAEVRRAECWANALKLLEDNWGRWEWKTNNTSGYIAGNAELKVEIDSIVHEINTLRVDEQNAHDKALTYFGEKDSLLGQTPK